MNTQTKTKLIESSYKNAPQIINEYGSLLNVLTQVLSEGFNEQSVNSFEFLSDNTMKISLIRNHGYLYNQVVSLTGSILSEMNIQYRVKESRHNYIVVENPFTDITPESVEASGVTIKISPLGYKQVYVNDTGTVKCFQNKSLKSPGVLKVIDEIPPNGYSTGWTKFARVVAGQEVDEFGEFLSDDKVPYNHLYPQAEYTGNGVSGESGIHGFASWPYADGTDYYNRQNSGPYNNFPKSWKVIGDDKTFYLILEPSQKDRYIMHGFGNFISDNNEETTNICLQARDRFYPANAAIESIYERCETRFGSATNNRGSFLLSTIYGQTKTTCRYTSFGLYVGESYYDRPWHSTSIKSLNPSSGQLMSGLMYIKDDENYIRGYHRGIRYIYGNSSNFTSGSVSSTSNVVLAVVDPERDREVSYLFSLADWEDV